MNTITDDVFCCQKTVARSLLRSRLSRLAEVCSGDQDCDNAVLATDLL